MNGRQADGMTEIGGAAGGRVVALWRYRSDMTDPILNALLGYWERLRRGRIAPRRIEIDPREIEDLLQHAFILERLEGAAPRFRVAGAHLAEAMGMEMRGMPADCLIAPAHRARFLALLSRIFTDPVIAELDLRPETGAGGTARMLLLPLKGNDQAISRILGGLVMPGSGTLPAPRRLIPVATRCQRIVITEAAADPQAAAPVDPAPPSADAPAPAQPPGLSEPAAPFHPPPRAPAGRPWLRLVKSDD